MQISRIYGIALAASLGLSACSSPEPEAIFVAPEPVYNKYGEVGGGEGRPPCTETAASGDCIPYTPPGGGDPTGAGRTPGTAATT